MSRTDKSRRSIAGFSATLLGALTIAVACSPAAAKSGSLDPSFGERGSFTAGGTVRAVVGAEFFGKNRLITALSLYGKEENLISAAYLTDRGTRDRDFGFRGSAYSRRAAPSSAATDVAVSPDGTYFAGGWHGRVLGEKGYVVAHFDASGEPILRFGTRGTAIGKVRKDLALTGIDVQADGKVVASGGFRVSRGKRPAGIVMRFNKDGRPDKSFSGDGIARFPVKKRGGSSTALMDIEVLPNGRIVASGYSRGNVIAVKLRKNGKRDRSFGGGDGVQTIPRRSENDCLVNGWCLDAALDVSPKGDLLILSNIETQEAFQPNGAHVVRLSQSGKRRHSFGHRGVKYLGRKLQDGSDIVARKNGKVVVAGSIKRKMGAIQLKKNGAIDKSFGRKGRVVTGGPQIADSVLLDGKGRITLAGATGDWVKFARFLR